MVAADVSHATAFLAQEPNTTTHRLTQQVTIHTVWPEQGDTLKHIRRVATLAALMLGAGALGLIAAGAAAAHVTVSSPNAVQGGYATLTFKVPTESATASTTALKVQLPTDHPLASVSVQQIPGWSYTVTTTKLATPITSHGNQLSQAVSMIEWRADSAATAIKPGEFNQFIVSAGPLPQESAMTFKAIQTYSDGSIVSWIEEAAPGSSVTPDHPAPVLTLTAASNPTDQNSAAADATVPTAKSGSDNKPTIAIVLGVVAIVLGAAALATSTLRGRDRGNATT